MLPGDLRHVATSCHHICYMSMVNRRIDRQTDRQIDRQIAGYDLPPHVRCMLAACTYLASKSRSAQRTIRWAVFIYTALISDVVSSMRSKEVSRTESCVSRAKNPLQEILEVSAGRRVRARVGSMTAIQQP